MPKKKYPSDNLAKLNIRLPHTLRTKLKKASEKEGRTMNSQAVQLLKKGLEELAA